MLKPRFHSARIQISGQRQEQLLQAGALGGGPLSAGLVRAGPVALALAAGISAFAWWRIEPVSIGAVMGGAALFGRFRTLAPIAISNAVSFAILWVGGLAFLLASGATYYLYVTLVCACAQAVWLAQHLWGYYRDHPRMRYEQ